MAPIILTTPTILGGVLFMLLGLGSYWLSGMGPLRGWVLLALFAVSLLFFLYGVHLVWRWTKERRRALADLPPEGETFENRPWLGKTPWRRREIVSGRVVGTSALAAAYFFFGTPAVFFLWVGLTGQETRSGESLVFPGLYMGLILAFIVAGLTYWRLRHWRYGDSVCRLLTLPGRVGGRLDVDVHCALPRGNDDIVTVRLRNMLPGKRPRELWRMEERIAVPVQGERTVVPVRLQIPRHKNQQLLAPNAGVLDRASPPFWQLEIEKKVAGIDFYAQFGVPVYDVPESAVEMPRAEAPRPLPEDPAGRRTAQAITLAGLAAVAAITYRASETGWLSTGVMTPSAAWMSAERFQREFDVWSPSHFPPAVEGRCNQGRVEYRSEWRPIPYGGSFFTWYGMSRRDYQFKQKEYAARGYSLEATTSFTDCNGGERVQATWLRNKLAPVER